MIAALPIVVGIAACIFLIAALRLTQPPTPTRHHNIFDEETEL